MRSGAYSADLRVGVVCVTWTSAGAGGLIYNLQSDEQSEINPPKPLILFPGRMDPQPSGVPTVATEPRWPSLEKVAIRPGKPVDQVGRPPSTPLNNRIGRNANWAPPSTGALLAPVQTNE